MENRTNNAGVHSYSKVMVNIMAMFAGFFVIGLLVIFLNRLLKRN